MMTSMICRPLESGLTFAPDDAAEDVYDAADIGLDNPGGRGAVREAIEYILAAQDKWEKLLLHMSKLDKEIDNNVALLFIKNNEYRNFLAAL